MQILFIWSSTNLVRSYMLMISRSSLNMAKSNYKFIISQTGVFCDSLKSWLLCKYFSSDLQQTWSEVICGWYLVPVWIWLSHQLQTVLIINLADGRNLWQFATLVVKSILQDIYVSPLQGETYCFKALSVYPSVQIRPSKSIGHTSASEW